MTLLAELFERLESAPENSGNFPDLAGNPIPLASVVEVATLAPATNDHQTAMEAQHATTAAPPVPAQAPAPERPAKARRNAWTITRGGKPICTICGAPMTRAEALDEARWRWPDADILEN